MKEITIIGCGISSLSAACYMAENGHSVKIFEKNKTIGGRARQLKIEDFIFDMGPTFYWMPDIFEKFFSDFGRKSSDFYNLIRLDPGYEVYFGENHSIPVPANFDLISEVFEKYEPGSSKFLKKFLKNAEFNYKVAMDRVVYKPGKTPFELIIPETVTRVSQFAASLSHVVRRNIKDPQLRQILEFPVIFLGAKPSDIPAFYCFMNYADMKLGTWHVEGGLFEMVKGMQKLAEELGVEIYTDSPVEDIIVNNGKARGVVVNDRFYPSDAIISGADYHHTETILDKKYRNYSEKYWESRVMAPSALMYYAAFDKKIDKVSHHTLFFDTDFGIHAEKIYDDPQWPQSPLFYASFPTKTDSSMGPENKEAAVFLIPVASGLEDTPEIRKKYFDEIILRMEKLTGQSLKDDVLFYDSFTVSDFTRDYNAYKGNAYGLSNILIQTAFLKPKAYNKKIKNLFYTGQLTVPGPGVPTAVISGTVAAKLAISQLEKSYN